jgi:hypothetical protein
MTEDPVATLSVSRKRCHTPSPHLKPIIMSQSTLENVERVKRFRIETFQEEEEVEENVLARTNETPAQQSTPGLVNSTADSVLQFDMEMDKAAEVAKITTIETLMDNKSLETRADEIKRVCVKIEVIVHPDNRTTPVGLGSGVNAELNGEVFAFRVGDREMLACKNVADMDEEGESGDTLRAIAEEARIAAMISKTFVLPSCASFGSVSRTRPSSPHFTALLRHDLMHTALKAKKFVVIDQKWKRAVSMMYLELCQRWTLSNYLYEHTGVGLIADDDARLLAASIAGQLIMAILALGSMSVSHNDMRLSNVLLLASKTPEAGLFYCVPRANVLALNDTYIRLPGGNGIPLLVVSDFGVSSVDKYENDAHFRHLGIEGAEALAGIYYDADKIDRADFSRLSLTSHGDKLGHYRPMSHVKLGEFERDFATLFTFFEELVPVAERPWLAYLKQIGTTAIDALSAARPTSYKEQRRFAINLFKNCDLLKDCIVSASTLQSAWRLPTDDQGSQLRRELIRELDKPVIKGHQFNLIN